MDISNKEYNGEKELSTAMTLKFCSYLFSFQSVYADTDIFKSVKSYLLGANNMHQ